MAAASVAFFFFELGFGKLYSSQQKKFMYRKDLRMRALDEMFRGVKTIKYNGYEKYFDGKVRIEQACIPHSFAYIFRSLTSDVRR